MKLGLDIHGVIDIYPEFFSELVRTLLKGDHEIHVLTGATFDKALKKLKIADVLFTHFFSITDYCTARGEQITFDTKGDPHMDKELWDGAKAEYCQRNEIDLHLDDSYTYSKYFKTPYIQVQKNIKQLIIIYPENVVFLDDVYYNPLIVFPIKEINGYNT